jgi:hypothetical protein
MATTILRLALFTTRDSRWRNVLEHYWGKANEILAPHGMALAHRHGSGSPTPDEIGYTGDVVRKFGDTATVRQRCHELWPTGKGCPVILCNYLEAEATSGNTVLPDDADAATANGGVSCLPYCTINARRYVASGSTLLHELIHATGLHDSDHEGSVDSVFCGTSSETSLARKLSKPLAERLRRCYFAEAATA